MKLYIDFETRSTIDLRNVGAWRYAEDPTTQIICLALKADNKEPLIWFPKWVTDSFPEIKPRQTIMDKGIITLLALAEEIHAHNCEFERSIWLNIMCNRYGFKDLDLEKCYCTAAKAAMHALPRNLEDACVIMGADVKKDQEGRKLMLKMCKPRKPRKKEKLEDPNWHTKTYWYEDPKDIIRLAEYCKQDVEAEAALDSRLADLPASERKVYILDQQINQRGFQIDTLSAGLFLKELERKESKLLEAFRELTDYQVDSPRQVTNFINWAGIRGEYLENLQAATVAAAVKEVKDKKVKKALQIRQSMSKASTKKLDKMRASACSDGRIRGTFLYYGASTGRWSGKGVQPQNLPRPFKHVDKALDFLHKDPGMLDIMYGTFNAASNCLRSMIFAKEGCVLVIRDFSAIESRVLAWLAGEEHIIQAYKENTGIYELNAAAIYGVPYEEVTSEQRQVGKVAELALGYQGGVSAFAQMAKVYGLSMSSEQAEFIKGGWRESRPATQRLWFQINKMAMNAIMDPGQVYSYRKISATAHAGFLKVRLPSGRILYYKQPAVTKKMQPWGKEGTVISFFGVDGYTRKWQKIFTYGGKLVENIVQGIARDLLAEAMNKCQNYEATRDRIVMTVHDEIVLEVPEAEAEVALNTCKDIMAVMPAWAEGLPMKSSGEISRRYKK